MIKLFETDPDPIVKRFRHPLDEAFQKQMPPGEDFKANCRLRIIYYCYLDTIQCFLTEDYFNVSDLEKDKITFMFPTNTVIPTLSRLIPELD